MTAQTPPGMPARFSEGASAVPTLQLTLGVEFVYETAPGTALVIMVEPPAATDRALSLRATRSVSPDTPLRLALDSFGNWLWRVAPAGGRFSVSYDALFAVPDAPDPTDWAAEQLPVQDLPDDVLQFLLPSRFCQSDVLGEQAQELFGAGPVGYARVQAVCDWVHQNVIYGYEFAGPSVSALDTLQTRRGVCRDFAHLPVAFCRALSIPARYTFGYLPDYGIEPPDVPMDFHAWFEVYLGGRWHTFDARHNTPRIGRVVIAHGRDAADVAMVTSYGAANLLEMRVWTDAEPAGG